MTAPSTSALEMDSAAVSGSVQRLVLPCGVTLYHGDCLDVLPTLESVDAVVSDPPFGIGFDYGDAHDDDPKQYEEIMRKVVAECTRLVGDGPVMMWQAMLQAPHWHRWFPENFRILAACKGFVQYRPHPIQYSFDPVVTWGKPKVKPSVYRKDWHVQSLAPFGAGRAKIDHPCPRPLEQTQYFVSLAAESGTILDPFMGSGTTGVAAVMSGLGFIGIEKDAKHFETAAKRIRAATAQGDLFHGQNAV